MFSEFQYEIKCNFSLYSGNLDSVALPVASPIQMNVRTQKDLKPSRSQDFLMGGRGKPQNACMTSSKFFERGTFCRTNISWNERSEAVASVWHLNRILLKGEGLNQKLKVKMSELGNAFSKL